MPFILRIPDGASAESRQEDRHLSRHIELQVPHLFREVDRSAWEWIGAHSGTTLLYSNLHRCI